MINGYDFEKEGFRSRTMMLSNVKMMKVIMMMMVMMMIYEKKE